LSDRDWLVLRSVNQHRFLTTAQIEGFGFRDHASEATAARTCRRVLQRLERDGLLRALPRRQGGPTGGSTPATWQLAPGGARLLGGHGPNYRISLPTTRHLAHCLAVADAHLAVLDHARRAGLGTAVTVEQQAWRRYTGLGGERLWLKPDLFAVLSGHDAHGAYEDRWFIEVDRGTESLPTLLKKCEQYEAYRRSGTEQAEAGTFPLVLWIFDDPARGAALCRAVGRRARLTPALYRYAEFDTVAGVLAGGPS
jgi:hypothetical protein